MDEFVEHDLRESLAVWVDAAAADRLVARAEDASAGVERRLQPVGTTDGIAAAIDAEIAKNLAAKVEFSRNVSPLPLTEDELAREVIDWEAFKAETTVTAGVYPRRYFGYVDEKADTAAYETRLRLTVGAAVDVVNAYQEDRGDPLRITDLEVTTTWLAEGGALWMRDEPEHLNALHPVYDIGLDDIASGFGDLPGLQARLDAKLGTDLGGIVVWVPKGGTPPPGLGWVRSDRTDADPLLTRNFTFEESIVATALMWTWEKEIARRKIDAEGWKSLDQRPLDEQFVIGSLVYNSGRLHAPATWDAIRNFTNAAKLVEISESNASRRPRLPVLLPKAMLDRLRGGEGYFDQNTSWLGQYHVAQRWGGYVGLAKYSGRFDEAGKFAGAPPPAQGMPRLEKPEVPKSAVPSGIPMTMPATIPIRPWTLAGAIAAMATAAALLMAAIVAARRGLQNES
jgi:hypothetical protein